VYDDISLEREERNEYLWYYFIIYLRLNDLEQIVTENNAPQQQIISSKKIAFWSKIDHPRMLAFYFTHDHFRSRDKNGGHTIRSAIDENPMQHANFTALCFIEMELLPIEVLHQLSLNTSYKSLWYSVNSDVCSMSFKVTSKIKKKFNVPFPYRGARGFCAIAFAKSYSKLIDTAIAAKWDIFYCI